MPLSVVFCVSATVLRRPLSFHQNHPPPSRATLPPPIIAAIPLLPSGPTLLPLLPSPSSYQGHPPPIIPAIPLLPSAPRPPPPASHQAHPPSYFSIFAIPCHHPRLAHSRPFPSQSSHHYHHVIKCHKRTHPPQPPAHQPKLN